MSPQPRNRSRAPMRSVGAKATTPPREVAQRASRNGGAVSSARKRRVLTPQQRWEAAVDGVLERFRADMAVRYADEPENGAESVSKSSAGTGTPDRRENPPGRAGASRNRYQGTTTGAAE